VSSELNSNRVRIIFGALAHLPTKLGTGHSAFHHSTLCLSATYFHWQCYWAFHFSFSCKSLSSCRFSVRNSVEVELINYSINSLIKHDLSIAISWKRQSLGSFGCDETKWWRIQHRATWCEPIQNHTTKCSTNDQIGFKRNCRLLFGAYWCLCECDNVQWAVKCASQWGSSIILPDWRMALQRQRVNRLLSLLVKIALHYSISLCPLCVIFGH